MCCEVTGSQVPALCLTHLCLVVTVSLVNLSQQTQHHHLKPACGPVLAFFSLCELGSAEVNSDALSLSHPQILRNQSDNFQSSDRNHHKS